MGYFSFTFCLITQGMWYKVFGVGSNTFYNPFIQNVLKFIYSEKATKFCEISTVNLSYVVPVKSMVEILKNCVTFSEDMNFTAGS